MLEVVRDHSLKIPTISVPITNEGTNSGVPEATDNLTRQQTKVDGVVTPLIRINNMTIMSSQVQRMVLTCNPVPTVDLEIVDALNIIKSIDSPTSDNRLQLQIIPAVDNTYRKINLQFFITSSSIVGETVYITGSYYVPRLYDSVMKAYGQLTTYELFDQVSSEYGLGFSSNVVSTEDTRWIYNPNKSVIDLLSEQVEFSAESTSDISTQDIHVFDWWIGFYNELNFIDIYKEYKEVLPDDKMQVWSMNVRPKVASDEEPKVEKMLKMFTNLPSMRTSIQYISNYTPVSIYPSATDINYEVFSMNTLERISTVVMDGDMKNNILMRYQYGGEVFGEYDYLTRKACREILMSKINNQTIEVECHAPMFGFMKGEKVNVYWYDINNPYSQDLQDKGNSTISSNIPLPESIKFQDSKMIINKTISGQYYIIDTELAYNAGVWSHKFRLGRYSDQVQRLETTEKTNE